MGSLSPTFSRVMRGISPTDLVKASIFSTSLMLRASGMGTPALSPASSSSSPFHPFTESRRLSAFRFPFQSWQDGQGLLLFQHECDCFANILCAVLVGRRGPKI